MAIGDGNNTTNSGNKKIYDQSFYARQSFNDENDKLKLSIEYRGGNMIMKLSDIKEGFHYEDRIAIHLSPTKAKILASQIQLYRIKMEQKDIKPNEAFGVNAGMGEKVTYINFHSDDGKKFMFDIGKFDSNGVKTEVTTFVFKQNYHYGLNWKDNNKNDLEKKYFNNLDMDIIAGFITDFSKNMNGAVAYSVWDLGRYEVGRVLSKMDPIYDKLGIERRNSGSSNFNGGTNSFLNNTSGSSSSTNFDTIEAMMDEE